MNRRSFLKGITGVTIAVAIPLPVSTMPKFMATSEAFDKATWWRANFTILKTELSQSIESGFWFLRVIATMNGHEDRAVYAAVQIFDPDNVDPEEVIGRLKDQIIIHVKGKGWMK